MKRTGVMIRVAVCVLCMLIALAFAAIEGWQLLSGDWKLFENDRLALIRIIVKMLLCLYCFAICLRAALRRKRSFLWEGIGMLGITLGAASFISNHLGEMFVLLAVLFLISEPALWRRVRRGSSPDIAKGNE